MTGDHKSVAGQAHAPNRWIALWLLGTLPRIACRPWLWRTAARFLAWPPWGLWSFVQFRYTTMYGASKGDSADVVGFLAWAKRAAQLDRSLAPPPEEHADPAHRAAPPAQLAPCPTRPGVVGRALGRQLHAWKTRLHGR